MLLFLQKAEVFFVEDYFLDFGAGSEVGGVFARDKAQEVDDLVEHGLVLVEGVFLRGVGFERGEARAELLDLGVDGAAVRVEEVF